MNMITAHLNTGNLRKAIGIIFLSIFVLSWIALSGGFVAIFHTMFEIKGLESNLMFFGGLISIIASIIAVIMFCLWCIIKHPRKTLSVILGTIAYFVVTINYNHGFYSEVAIITNGLLALFIFFVALPFLFPIMINWAMD